MNHNEIETLKKQLSNCEPLVSESLTDEVLRDVEAVLSSPKQRLPKHFNTQLHCTKKSRCRSTFFGTILGASLGLLIGVTLAIFIIGHREKEIVYVEAPVKKETQPSPKKDRTNNSDRFLLAQADSNRETVSEIDKLIEETLEQKRRIVIPESLRSQYVQRCYVASSVTISPDQSLLLLQRELLECYQ